MAFPIANSPMFPSVADVPGLPPKFGEMPIVNGTAYYVCDDGFAGTMSEAQAINRNQNCKAPYGGGMPMARVGTGLWGSDAPAQANRNAGNQNAGWLFSPPEYPSFVSPLSPLDVLSPVSAGRSYYVCDDGIAGVMSGYEAAALRKNCRILTGINGRTKQGLGRIPSGSRFLGADPAPAPAPAPTPAPIIQQVPVYYPIPQAPAAPAAPAPAPTIVNEIPPAYLVGGAVAAVAIGFLLSKLG